MIIRKNFKKRVEFIKDVLKKSEASGNDSALVGILCKAACNDTVGTRVVDLTAVKAAEIESLESSVDLNKDALANMAPRLRMITLYAIKCEIFV